MLCVDRCNKSYNTLENPSFKIRVANKIEGVDEKVFNMITRINEAKTTTKQISCDSKCKFDGKEYNSKQKWNVDKCWCECKKLLNCSVCKEVYAWNLLILFYHLLIFMGILLFIKIHISCY